MQVSLYSSAAPDERGVRAIERRRFKGEVKLIKKRIPKVHTEDDAISNVTTADFGNVESALMKELPQEIQHEVLRHAAVKLGLLWVPRVIVSSRHKEAGGVVTHGHRHDQIASVLRTGMLFSSWEDADLRNLADEATPVSTQPGDTIIKEGDSSRSGVWVILSGSGVITRRGKGKGADQVLFRFTAPVLFGDFAILTDEPRTASIVLETQCSCWIIYRAPIFKAVALLDPRMRELTYDKAFLRRQKTIEVNYPRSPDDMRQCPLMVAFSDAECTRVMTYLEPLVVRKGTYVYRKGDTGRAVYFLCSGKVEREGGGEEGACVHTATHMPSFGAMAFLFDCGECMEDMLALTHCDIWVLPYARLEEYCSVTEVQKKICASAKASRLQQMNLQVENPERILRCADLLAQTAILGEVLPRAVCVAVATEMRPLVFLPRQNMLSAVDECDRLFVMQCGCAFVQNGVRSRASNICTGDVFGMTLVALHRWLFPVQTITGCDLWYIDKAAFIALLHQHSCYTQYVTAVRAHFTENEYLPRKVLLGKRVSAAGLKAPPLLYPCAGLPEEVAVPYHFDEDVQVGGAARKRRVYSSNDCQVAKRTWVILQPSAPKGDKRDSGGGGGGGGSADNDTAPAPVRKPPASYKYAVDLSKALANLKPPSKMNGRKRRG